MKDIKQIIANNLIALRKKHNLTQGQLAEKVNYSDNAVSRWERGEVTPSVETLQQISEIFNIPITSLMEENALGYVTKEDKKVLKNKIAIMLICVSLVWLIATVLFVQIKYVVGFELWQIFVWAIPCTTAIMFPFKKYLGRHIFEFVILSVFLWSMITCFYLQFLEYNIWLIYLIGVPVQAALSVWAFVKPKKK